MEVVMKIKLDPYFKITKYLSLQMELVVKIKFVCDLKICNLNTGTSMFENGASVKNEASSVFLLQDNQIKNGVCI